jgi:hypothetical protein
MTTSYILKRQAELRKNKALMRAAERAESEVVAENNRLAKLADAARLQEKLARIKQGAPAPVSVAIEAPSPVAPKTVQSKAPKAKVSFRKKSVKGETSDAS